MAFQSSISDTKVITLIIRTQTIRLNKTNVGGNGSSVFRGRMVNCGVINPSKGGPGTDQKKPTWSGCEMLVSWNRRNTAKVRCKGIMTTTRQNNHKTMQNGSISFKKRKANNHKEMHKTCTTHTQKK